VRAGTAEAGSGQTEPGQPLTGDVERPASRVRPAAVPAAAGLLLFSLFVWVLEALLTKNFVHFLTWFDLDVYNRAGLIVLHHPKVLYTWHWPAKKWIKYTYTPFAAMLFAVTSALPVTVLHWGMTAVSIAVLPVIAWLVFGQLGWHDRDRLVGTLVAAAIGLWTEPVIRALQLGQIELLLMLLIVWDLGQSDRRWWKGAGIGVAAAIKLVPLIFIPYLLLCGKIRQAVMATATVAISILIGFAVLPDASTKWWLTGYFLHAGNTGDVGSLENQSLLAAATRVISTVGTATKVWLPLAVLIAVIGLCAAAALHRRGQLVAGWVTCALTGLLVSPISWDQHWIWIVPVLIVLADLAVRSRGAARWAWWAAAALTIGLYGDWPYAWTGKNALLSYYGLLGLFRHQHPLSEQYHLHGFQFVTWNLFVIAGLVMLIVAVVAAVRSRPSRESAEASRGNSPHPA
jgi:alpha-1,2-mannosyltransferase